MESTKEKVEDDSAETISDRKIWETPKLKVLPVPTKTHGGLFNVNDQDDTFYKKS